MRAQDALHQFERFWKGNANCFEGVSSRAYHRSVAPDFMTSRLPWTIPATVTTPLSICREPLLAAREELNVIHGLHSEPASVLLATIRLLKRRYAQISLCGVLNCFAAWIVVREKCSAPTRTGLDRCFETGNNDRQKIYVDRLQEAVATFRNCVTANRFGEAQLLLDEIEENLDVAPSAFFAANCRNVLATLRKIVRLQRTMANKGPIWITKQISALQRTVDEFGQTRNILFEVPDSDSLAALVKRHVVSAELVGEYTRLSRAVGLMRAFMRRANDKYWPISDIKSVREIFSTSEFGAVVPLLSKVDASEMILSTHDQILLLDGGDGSVAKAWRELASRISDPVYHGNQMHVNTLLHYFFGFLVAGAQQCKVEVAMQLFEKKVVLLDAVLFRLIHCTPQYCWRLWRAIAARMSDSTFLKVGHAYYYGGTMAGGSVHQLFSNTAEEIKNEVGSEFGRQHYTEFGFIFPEEFQFPQIAQEHLLAPSPSPVLPAQLADGSMVLSEDKSFRSDASDQVTIVELLAKEKYSQTIMEKQKGKNYSFYRDHQEFATKWWEKWSQIVRNNEGRCTDLISELTLPTNPLPEDVLDRKKIIPDGKTLRSIIPGRGLEVPKNDKNAHERYMIGRLIVMGLAMEIPNIDTVAYLCGFRGNTKPVPAGSLHRAADMGGFEGYLDALGLQLTGLSSPLQSDWLNRRERDFLEQRPWCK